MAASDDTGTGHTITLRVDGTRHRLVVDPRRTPLDLIREQLGQPVAKQGCAHGQCGACTLLVGGAGCWPA
jgi:xanthine dehydrogenase YagT iron-sulfur-binding subunit